MFVVISFAKQFLSFSVLLEVYCMSRFQVEPTVAILDECFDTFYCGLSEKVIMLLTFIVD